jgi:hypothetical protein
MKKTGVILVLSLLILVAHSADEQVTATAEVLPPVQAPPAAAAQIIVVPQKLGKRKSINGTVERVKRPLGPDGKPIRIFGHRDHNKTGNNGTHNHTHNWTHNGTRNWTRNETHNKMRNHTHNWSKDGVNRTEKLAQRRDKNGTLNRTRKWKNLPKQIPIPKDLTSASAQVPQVSVPVVPAPVVPAPVDPIPVVSIETIAQTVPSV